MSRALIVLLIVFISCKKQEKETTYAIAENIANAHGFENWNTVKEIQFTFNVDRDSSHFERSWIWNTKTNQVTSFTKKDTVTYNRNKIEKTNQQTDLAFINDKYWAFFPFQLIWDKNATLNIPIKTESPIENKPLNKITLTYPEKGGYTPGDAYDVFYDDNYIIKEWIYREKNAKKASLISTFENYKKFNGLLIAQEHKKLKNNWNLKLTNIKVITE